MTLVELAIAQLNPTLGDLDGNLAKIFAAYLEAATAGAQLVIAPECVLTGYPLEDLVLRPSFVTATRNAVARLAEMVRTFGADAALIFGAPYPAPDGGGVANCAFLIDPRDGELIVRHKVELPNYGVFDEKRVFIQSGQPAVIDWRGIRLGLMICEDCWLPHVSQALVAQGATLLVAINGSPFEVGKNLVRRQIVANRIRETGLPFVYANLVGGQDELVFDGGSFVYDGRAVQTAPHFTEGVWAFGIEVVPGRAVDLKSYEPVEPSATPEIYQACVLGLRDYLLKQGFASVVLGYSGGVDSGLVAAMACDALGSQAVHLVRLPSRYSSAGSLTDAEHGARNLGAVMRTIPIEGAVQALREAYAGGSGTRLTGVADENVQARARGAVLMAISNQESRILLTTGNKSEMSVGYSTLYGDMSGGFNPIKDCYKTTVWDLCRWRNGLTPADIVGLGFAGPATEVVPEAIITKPPSAELRPEQKDEDSLPPYPVLDAILRLMIEGEASVSEICAEGFDEPVVRHVRTLIDRAEYKRRQAAPGVKITSKLYGRDRRYPIVNHWRT